MKADPSAPGRVAFVGAGPGQADLITLRGAQRLGRADVVLFDSLADPALRALAPKARWVDVGKRGFSGVPHGSREPGAENAGQAMINALLVKHALAGSFVVRLKGGDPSVFGRLEEELEALAAADIECEVVPGVSAAEGCAAYAGIPLTLRGVSQAVLLTTGHSQDDSTAAVAQFRPGQTLALYMGVAQYSEIGAALIARGHDPGTPVAIVENGTTQRQRVIRTVLGELARAQAELAISPPALLLVGETTRFAERYSWFEPSKVEVFGDEASRARARVSY